jgi:hypothetical protein
VWHLGFGMGLTSPTCLRHPPGAPSSRSRTTSRSAGPVAPWSAQTRCSPAGGEDERIWGVLPTTSFPRRRRMPASSRCSSRPTSRDRSPTSWTPPIRQGRVDVLLKILDVAGAVSRDHGTWTRTAGSWTYDAERGGSAPEHPRRASRRCGRISAPTDASWHSSVPS